MVVFTDGLLDVVRSAILPSGARAAPGRNRQAEPWR